MIVAVDIDLDAVALEEGLDPVHHLGRVAVPAAARTDCVVASDDLPRSRRRAKFLVEPGELCLGVLRRDIFRDRAVDLFPVLVNQRRAVYDELSTSGAPNVLPLTLR